MNIVFEDIKNKLNFIRCKDINKSGIARFTPSPMITTLFEKGHHNTNLFDSSRLPHYLVASGVNHSPEQWVRGFDNSVLDNLNPVYLEDIKNHKTLLVIDQSLEGHQTFWLWNDLHRDCERHSIDPRALIYITGNNQAPHQYGLWANSNSINRRIKVIPYEHFEMDLGKTGRLRGLSYTWSMQMAYKKLNPIKTFNCLNRRLRPHRIWFYTELYKNGLVDKGIVSMNRYNVHPLIIDNNIIDIKLLEEAQTQLPLEPYGQGNIEKDDYHYIRRIVDKFYLDSFISVVSEPQFAESDLSSFCSEKIFKSILSLHPFIIVGGKGSLARLRELGYKTFDGFIDEGYDNLDSKDRIESIINVLKYIDSIDDKLGWFESMREIIEHNFKHLIKNRMPQAGIELEKYYTEYFNV